MIYACISDIHGRGNEFINLLEKIKIFKRTINKEVRLVLLGDYCDRGNENLIVLDKLVEIKNTDPTAIILFGNHEEFIVGSFGFDRLDKKSELLHYHKSPRSILDCWTSINNGGSKTINELKPFLDEAKKGGYDKIKDYVDFLCELPDLVEIDNIVFSHAPLHRGVVVSRGLEKLASPYKLWNINTVNINNIHYFIMSEPYSDKVFSFINIHGHIHNFYKNEEINDIKVDEKTLCLNVSSFPKLSVTYVDSDNNSENFVIGHDIAD